MLFRELFPKPGFFVPDTVRERQFEERIRDAARAAPRVLHLTHASCLDGATCDALVRMARGSGVVRTAYLEPHETLAALRLVAAERGRGRDLVVSDLSFQQGQGANVLAAVEGAAANGWRVTWRDHHHKQWEGAPIEDLAKVGDFTVDFSGKECGATLVATALLPDDAFAQELARVVRDHDLWLLEDPRSKRLASASFEAGSRDFVERVMESRNLDDPQLARWADAADSEKESLVADGVASARLVAGARGVVGVAYGRVPTNDVLHALEEKGAHLSILLKPEGTFSLRSRKDVPLCQRVASRFGGGGHPNASGGRLRIPPALMPLFWLRRGDAGPGRELVAAALREVDAFLAGQPTDPDST